jgi:hypothetical protein
MKFAKNLATLSVAVVSAGAVSVAAPAISHAAPMNTQVIKSKKMLALDENSNAAVSVNTELDCANHTLTAKVTNKLKTNITPDVTFNDQQPTLPSNLPIEPGKTGYYYYNYSGNNLLVNTEVSVDGYSPLSLSPTLYCSEPVSFQVTGASDGAVVGTLTNNSSLVSQTVLTRVNNGDVRTEALQPGESRLIALPFASYPGATDAYVVIGTTNGYQGAYSVNLDQPPIMRPLNF